MDNFHIDITCEGREALGHALHVALTNGATATHWAIHKRDIDGYEKPRLVLYWHEPTGEHGASRLPFKLTEHTAADFVWNWLLQQDRGPEPDHDGSNGVHGWRIYCEDWGHVDGSRCAIAAIEPEWAWYGK